MRFYYRSYKNERREAVTRKRMTVLLFLILLVAVGVRADLPMLYSSLQKDLKEAQQYFN